MKPNVDSNVDPNVDPNVDLEETAHFERLAARWWDPEGEMRPLHALNPVRLEYIEQRSGDLRGKTVLDVGCGGGLLSEAMAARGAEVTGIDAADGPLRVAGLHLAESGLQVNYRHATAEAFAADHADQFDLVTCLEMLEHVPDPASVVAACARLVRPCGDVIFSTLNRTPLAFGLGIVAAEYVLGLLPRGTHSYEKLIKPSELSGWCRQARLDVLDICGLHYNPLIAKTWTGGSAQINYLLHATRSHNAQ